jgi:hypothetical protein
MSTRARHKEGNQIFYDDKYNAAAIGGVWALCPTNAALHDPGMAHVIFEDFNDIDAATLAGWTATQAGAAGTWALADAPGGVALADSGSETVTQGINAQKIGEVFTPAADKDIFYEARVKVVDTFDDAELFIGLSITDTTIIAASANTSTDHIGWQCVTDDGVLLFTAEKAGTGATKSAATLVEDTWIKLGFHVRGVDTIDQYIDGVKVGTAHVTANITVLDTTLSFVCQSGGTNDPILHVDYVKCLQIR